MTSQRRYPRNSGATVGRSTLDTKTAVPVVLPQIAEMLDSFEGGNNYQ
jgi:hypothetical protein